VVGLQDVARKRSKGFSLGMGQRLGIAAALLGDPQVLLCDEPVNGLDPEGIVWIRTLLRGLAEEGRTVFVSSHLMSEMALMADHVIVIGRGRMLADTSVDELVRNAGQAVVTVRTPAPDLLTSELHAAGASVVRSGDGSLEVTGLPADGIGDLALRRHIALHELAPRAVSLESAYLTLTQEQTEFQTSGAAS
jgi:ABC-2 type transport system ATP-binding protein